VVPRRGLTLELELFEVDAVGACMDVNDGMCCLGKYVEVLKKRS
jgi:hypothetical protein